MRTLVGVTGMGIQGERLVEILEECRSRGVMAEFGIVAPVGRKGPHLGHLSFRDSCSEIVSVNSKFSRIPHNDIDRSA
jgi:MoaA/NifB/PqqE/SkfB family radical SAM enzyme